jgi:hypothetical protein
MPFEIDYDDEDAVDSACFYYFLAGAASAVLLTLLQFAASRFDGGSEF